MSPARSVKKKAALPASGPATSTGTSAAEAVDEQLARYRAMRDFSTTAEPSGSRSKSEGGANTATRLPFVIQKHAATRLHYDFRLGWQGVLKSWAVAKGPSYVTRDRRLAVQVEDHPMEYGGFEGTIPKGQYGGGTVLLWDQGTWEPHGDVDEGLRAGSLKFSLHGTKLEGKWTLVRMGGHAAQEAKPNWLLIKEHDKFEQSADARPVTEAAPDSVVTGRSLEQIAAAEDHTWNSNRGGDQQPGDTAEKAKKTPANRSRLAREHPTRARLAGAQQAKPTIYAEELSTAPEEAYPGFLKPQLATPVHQAPAGGDWLHELKLDGYRVQMHVEHHATGPKVTLYTRNGLDWTRRMPAVPQAALALPVSTAILDGEVVVLDGEGGTSFSKLQAAFDEGAPHPMTYFAFDLLHLDGHSLRGLPLRERKAVLAKLIAALGTEAQKVAETLRYSEHVEGAGSGPEIFSQACSLGAEGIIAKQAGARYTSGRGESWLKLKCVRRQEFVIGGFTLPGDRGSGVGSLLLGYYAASAPGSPGGLVHCGRTGTGFSQQTQRMLRPKLEALRAEKSPYSNNLSALARKGAVWVRPELVCEVEFATWTGDGLVRHASFQGLREDKAPGEVTREDSAPAMKRLRGKRSPAEDERELETADEDARGSAETHVDSQPTENRKTTDRETTERKSTDRKIAEQKTTQRKITEGKSKAVGVKEPEDAAPSAAASSPRSAAKTHAASARTIPTPDPAARPDSGGSATAQIRKDYAALLAGARLTHPAKILDAQSGVTKEQLARYYATVAEVMLPHIEQRPASIVRCPEGSTKQCFFQKHAGAGLPKALDSVEVPDKKTGKAEAYIMIERAEGLVSLAQLGVLEIHPWGSRSETLERPDRLIFDLDPDEALPWPKLAESARSIRGFLRELKLESYVKTTGGKGLHLVVPIAPTVDWPQVKLFCRGVAAAIESGDPSLYLIKMTKAARKGRIFVDYLRNERGSTAVAPYSPRARPGMRVAVPLAWDELDAGMPTYAVANLESWADRLAHDPWREMPLNRQAIQPEILAAVLETVGKAG